MAVVRLAVELRRADPSLSLAQATEQARKMHTPNAGFCFLPDKCPLTGRCEASRSCIE